MKKLFRRLALGKTRSFEKTPPPAGGSHGRTTGVELLEPRLLFSESASAQLALVSTSGSGGSTVYHYDITVTNTGTTNIGTFWFGWVPGEDFLPSVPTATNPAGWNSTLTGSGSSLDGTAIEWVAASNPILSGHSLAGFSFTSTDSPSVLAGNSPSHPGSPVLTSTIYAGAPLSDAGFQFQVAPVTTAAASRTTLISSAPSVPAGSPVTFTVIVSPASGQGLFATGTVTFTRDGVVLGSPTLLPDGTASVTTASLPVGVSNITASYPGDSNYTSSISLPLAQTITPATTGTATSTTLAVSPVSAPLGQSVSLTATVTPSAAGQAPTGSVNFTIGGTLIGSAPVQSNGVATFATSSLSIGSSSVVATYSGDSVYASSASAATPLTITDPAALTAAIASTRLPAAVVGGTSVRGSARVNLTNQSQADINGKSTIAFYATLNGTIDGSAVLLGQTAKSLRIKASRSAVASIAIHTAAGTLPAGAYVLIARVTDPAGRMSDSAAGGAMQVAAPFVALTPTVGKSTLPASAASGATIHAVVDLTLANSGNVSTAGSSSIALFATADGTIGTTSTQLASAATRAPIRPGKAVRAALSVSLLPAMAPGVYTLVARVTDPNGQASQVTAGSFTITT